MGGTEFSRRGSSAAARVWRASVCLFALCWLASPAWSNTMDDYDLGYGQMTVDYGGGPSPQASIVERIRSGLHDGPTGYWDGPGIRSSAAANHPRRLTALGIIDDGESVIVKYTWWGDANLDGVVNSADYDRIDSNWLRWKYDGTIPEGGFGWATGDFNYDGVITSADYDKIDTVWLITGGNTLVGDPPANTPEPVTLVLLSLAIGGLARYVRRRQRPA
jgi:hypothetical protein